MNKSYESPRIVDYGHLVDLTAGSTTGTFTDATFPVNTPRQATVLAFS